MYWKESFGKGPVRTKRSPVSTAHSLSGHSLQDLGHLLAEARQVEELHPIGANCVSRTPAVWRVRGSSLQEIKHGRCAAGRTMCEAVPSYVGQQGMRHALVESHSSGAWCADIIHKTSSLIAEVGSSNVGNVMGAAGETGGRGADE